MKSWSRALTGLLCAAMVIGFLAGGAIPAMAAEPEKTITGLGTGAITNPVRPADPSSAWSGSYVYYGKNYYREHARYRVLDKASDRFTETGKCLFLDCDDNIYIAEFDKRWEMSDLRAGLNGDRFLHKDGIFTEMEKKAIAQSTAAAHELVAGTGARMVSEWARALFREYEPLNGEKIFLLDIEDASNIAYGYSTTEREARNRMKGEYELPWWLRSTYGYDSGGAVLTDPSLGGYLTVSLYGDKNGVHPAFNVSLSSVLFSSFIPSADALEAGEPGAEYKLTLKDEDLGISPGAVTRDGMTVTVPYTITGAHAADATRVSVLLTHSPYFRGDTMTSGFDYMKLKTDSFGITGTGTFTLPDEYAEKSWGSDYHVYLLAEDVNGEKETDYASVPVELRRVNDAFNAVKPTSPPSPMTAPETAGVPKTGDTANFPLWISLILLGLIGIGSLGWTQRKHRG